MLKLLERRSESDRRKAALAAGHGPVADLASLTVRDPQRENARIYVIDTIKGPPEGVY